MTQKNPSASLQAHNFIYTGIIAFIFAVIAISAFFKMGIPGYNKNILFVYGLGAAVGLGLTLLFGVYGVFNTIKRKVTGTDIPFQAGHVSESSSLLFLSNSFLGKYLPHLAWVIIVIFLSISGFQVWGSPDIYSSAQEFQTATSDEPFAAQEFSIATSFWDVAVLPGFTEDMAAFGLSAVFVAILGGLILIMGKITKSSVFKYNKFWHVGAILIASPMAAIGLGFIPGFAQAHASVGGTNLPFIFATFLFQTINLYVMWATGLFLPLAHIIHNGIFVFGFAFAFSIALFAAPAIGRLRIKTTSSCLASRISNCLSFNSHYINRIKKLQEVL